MAEGHASPNYWLIWLYLFILTVTEIAVRRWRQKR